MYIPFWCPGSPPRTTELWRGSESFWRWWKWTVDAQVILEVSGSFLHLFLPTDAIPRTDVTYLELSPIHHGHLNIHSQSRYEPHQIFSNHPIKRALWSAVCPLSTPTNFLVNHLHTYIFTYAIGLTPLSNTPTSICRCRCRWRVALAPGRVRTRWYRR